MKRQSARLIELALLLGLLVTGACSRASSASSATPSPVVSAPSPTVAASPTPLAAPTATIPAPTPTRDVTATPTASASDVSIEISSGGTTRATLTSGESATVPTDDGVVNVSARYPLPLGSSGANGFRPYPITIKVDPSDYRVDVGDFTRSDTLSFVLRGTSAGPHKVSVQVAQTNVPAIAFTIDVVPSAAPTVASITGPSTITLGDNGKTINLHVGDQIILSLGTGYDWTVKVADPSIVGRVTKDTNAQGGQGAYQATKAGTTTLTATGDPPCRKVQPPCGLPSRTFKVQIVVR